MAVTSAQVQKGGRGGSVKEDLNRSYQLVYFVDTDDDNDGPETILGYFENTPSLPFFGDTYSSGNDSDTYAAVKDLSVKPIKEHNRRWVVTVKFGLPDRRDKDNNPETNPLLRRDEYNVSFSQISETATEGISRQDIAVGNIKQGDKTGIIVTSGEPAPQSVLPEKFAGDMIVTITRYMSQYDAAFYRRYVLRAINSDRRIFDDSNYGYIDVWDHKQVLLVSAPADLRYENGVMFWRVSHNFHLKQDGWDSRVANKGMNRNVQEGQPDGMGGVISSTDAPKDGQPPYSPVTDKEGRQVNEPVWLDAQGQPIKDPAAQQHLFLIWGVYEELPYGPLGFGRDG